jgi:hypothetical protein
MGWKRNVGIGVAGLFGLSVIGAALGGGAKDGGAAPEAAPAAMAITARELHAAFDANEIAAKSRFDGQRLAVTGTITAVGLDLLNNPVVSLETENEFQSVQAKFDKDAGDSLAALAKGQEITVVCGKVAAVIGVPILDDCLIG